MVQKLKSQEKGVTLIILVIIVMMMLIVTSSLLYGARGNLDVKELNKLYNDLELLEDKVQQYYFANQKVPTLDKYTNLGMISNLNPNDAPEEYYVLDLGKLEGIRLNFGKDYDSIKQGKGYASNYTDVYVVNRQSHTIYYPKGVVIDGITYYQLAKTYQQVERGTLPQTSETTPYYPDDSFWGLHGTSLENGLVISDGENEYVWVEVPKSITASATTDTQIENLLKEYAKDYLDSHVTDGWYDNNGKIETDSTADFTNDAGCGVTLSSYQNVKSKILQGIKNNGGFWMGRYEMGIKESTFRSNSNKSEITNASPKAVNSPDSYVYNWITVKEAQKLAMEMGTSKYQSSLMLAIQRALVCKFIETKEPKLKEDFTQDSTSWGNYKNATFTVESGEYFNSKTNTYEKITNLSYRNKPKNTAWLLTTGASSENKMMNIYDFAGNVSEYVLARSDQANKRTVSFSGGYSEEGNKQYATLGTMSEPTVRNEVSGGRNVLY